MHTAIMAPKCRFFPLCAFFYKERGRIYVVRTGGLKLKQRIYSRGLTKDTILLCFSPVVASVTSYWSGIHAYSKTIIKYL